MTKPETVGLSRARLARIDQFLKDRYVDAGKLPGAVTLVARKGEIAHLGVVGQADVERGTPLKEDSIFRIYSMTKPLTSVALMMLVEEGAIALDDPVEKFIPAWKDLGVFDAGVAPVFLTHRPTRPMQVVDLLRHTSGLTYGFQNRTNVDAAYRKAAFGGVDSKLPLDGMIAELAKLPLEFSPGEAWNYSVSTDVVGYLVQVVSGIPFQDFLRTRLIAPCAQLFDHVDVGQADGAGWVAVSRQPLPGGEDRRGAGWRGRRRPLGLWLNWGHGPCRACRR